MTDNAKPLVTKAGHESKDTGQTGGLVIVTGVGHQNMPASKIWTGKAHNEPGARSLPHTHGEAETGAYVLSGHARLYYGEGFKEHVDLSEGDYLFVPSYTPHIEANMSTTEPLVWLVSRSPKDIVENLPDVDDLILAGFQWA